MYVCQYKCKLCNKIITGKLLEDVNIVTIKDIEDYTDIPKQIIHNTVGHLGISDFVGLEDYEAYQLSQVNK